MSQELPARANLEHLKKQAKALLAEQRRTNPRATLAEAQLALARDYGFPSWPKLKTHVESLERDADPRAAFAYAVRENHFADARDLLRRHPELRATLNEPLPGESFGAKPLHPAVRHRNREMVDLLVGAGADINGKSEWWAGGFGLLEDVDASFAEFLIERGARMYPNAAAKLGWLDTLRDLVDADPNAANARGGDGQTPLHVAANVEVAEFLLDHGADIDALDVDHESTPAQYAVRERPDVARFLVSRGAKTDFLLAVALGDLERVRRFLDDDPASINTTVNDEYFPMRGPHAGGHIYTWTLGRAKSAHGIAREFDHAAVFDLLLSRGSEQQKLALACEMGDATTVDAILAANPTIASTLSAAERRKLPEAAENNLAKTVALMLRAGWPADTRGNMNSTALHFAAWLGNAKMVRDLIAHGAPINISDVHYDGTPLDWALHGVRNSWNKAKGDYPAVAEALLEAGGEYTPLLDDVELPATTQSVLDRFNAKKER